MIKDRIYKNSLSNFFQNDLFWVSCFANDEQLHDQG